MVRYDVPTEIPIVTLPGHEGRLGYFMHTYSGRKFFPCDPRQEEIFIEDIAHALSNQCRFNGHTECFYSVAEHCWHCSYAVPPEDALEALLHDAAEAYLGDLIRPLKMLPDLGGAYLKLEERVEACIAARYKLTYPWPDSVRHADEAVITAEMEQIIAARDKGHLHDSSVTADIQLKCWYPPQAKAMFLLRYEELSP
jgi:hypothetical protein